MMNATLSFIAILGVLSSLIQDAPSSLHFFSTNSVEHAMARVGLPPVKEPLWISTARNPVEVIPTDAAQYRAPQAALTLKASQSTAEVESRIVFQSAASGNYEIYVMDLPTGNVRRLTQSTVANIMPRLSPNGSQVAFASNRNGHYNIYVTDAAGDGSDVRQLTQGVNQEIAPTWSPSGDLIAFESIDINNPYPKACIVDLKAIVSGCLNGGYYSATPFWSSDECCIYIIGAEANIDQLYFVNRYDGSVTTPYSGGLPYIQGLAPSPDRAHVALDFDADNDIWNELVVDNQIVYDPGTPQVDALIGSWSPDSQSLIYTRVEYVVLNNRYVVNKTFVERVGANGGTPEPLLAGNGRERYPDWRMVDVSAPRSRMTPLPALLQNGPFEISWQGADVGPAGLAAFDVDFRLAGSSTWTPLLTHTVQTSMTLLGQPGTTLQFRVRGIDRVGNIEAEATAGAQTASVTFYHWVVPLQITDVRGYPVPQAQLLIDPAPLRVAPAQPGSNGRSISILEHSGRRTLTATAAALAGPLVMTQYVDSNAEVSMMLSPADNLIVNGGFEDQGATPPGWHIDWAGQPNYPGSNAYSGNAGITLGSAQTCPLPCLSPPVTVPMNGSRDLAAGSDGTLHAVSGGSYWYRPPGGAWIGPEDVSHGFNAIFAASYIALDAQQRPHILFSGLSGMRYTERDANGNWSYPELVSPIIDAVNLFHDFAIDSANNVHVLYDIGGRITYRQRTVHGSWQPEITFEQPPGFFQAHSFFVKGLDDSIHLIWEDKVHRRITKDGVMFTEAPLPVPVSSAVIGPDGTWHLFWIDKGIPQYAFKSIGNDWSASEALPGTNGFTSTDQPVPAIDSVGTLYLVSRIGFATQGLRRKLVGQPWSAPIGIAGWGYGSGSVTADAADQVHWLWISNGGSISYQSSLTPTHAFTQTLHQTVSIPSTAHQPTLAFQSRLRGLLSSSKSYVSVNVSNDTTFSRTLTLMGTTTRNGHSMWLDLEGAQGQTLTITFSLIQAAHEGLVHWDIDDVSLGSWRTPVITMATTQLTERLIFITGTNFINTPTVYLNNVALMDVTLITDGQLRATVPDAIPSGSYVLRVENAGGAQGTLPENVIIGHAVYLPVLTR